MEDCDKGLLEDLLVNEGEAISPEVFSDASSMVLESDLVICIGSSLREQPLRVLLKKAYTHTHKYQSIHFFLCVIILFYWITHTHTYGRWCIDRRIWFG